MNIRQVTSLAVLVLLISCSSSGADISKTIEISTDQLAEIRANPYIGGNGPGGFAAAALSNPGGDSNGEIHFTGFGPYLHEIEVAIDVNASVTSVVAGKVESNKERWRIRLPN